jgi:hypothetical protein
LAGSKKTTEQKKAVIAKKVVSFAKLYNEFHMQFVTSICDGNNIMCEKLGVLQTHRDKTQTRSAADSLTV